MGVGGAVDDGLAKDKVGAGVGGYGLSPDHDAELGGKEGEEVESG